MKLKSLLVAITLLANVFAMSSFPAAGAQAPGSEKTISDGVFTITAAPFPGLGERWNFSVARAGNWNPGDWAHLRIQNSNGLELDYDFKYVSVYGVAQQSLSFVVSVSKGITPASIQSGIFVVLDVDYYQIPDIISKYRLPAEIFPAAPATSSDYARFGNGTALFTRPASCGNQNVFIEVSDPYREIASLNVSLSTNEGLEIDSTSVDTTWSTNLGLDPYASFTLCSSDFDAIKPVQLIGTITWADKTRATYSFTGTAQMSPYSSNAVATAVESMPSSCLKGNLLKNTNAAQCPTGYKKLVFKSPTVSQWNSVSRQPGSNTNSNWLVFGCITQLDSQTGASAFRADLSRNEPNYSPKMVNSWLSWSKSPLLAFDEGDLFVANLTVAGKQTYATLLGSKLTIPKFQVRSMKKLGSCGY